MNRWFGVLGLVIILLAAFIIRFPGQEGDATTFTGLFVSESIARYPVMVEVVPYDEAAIGIALDDYELDFGILSQGMVARKTVNLDNHGVPVRVRAWVEGNISGMAGLSRDDFILKSPGSIEVRLEASEPGNYTGTLFISTSRPNYRWMGWVTPWI